MRIAGSSRRDMLRGAAALALGGSLSHAHAGGSREPKKPRVACIGTEYRDNSHVDVILTKLLEGCVVKNPAGYPDEIYTPAVSVVSIYLDQFPANDMGRAMAQKHRVPIFETIEGALTLGGKELAVDGVVLIGEHGRYPYNDRGQHMYPRRRLFEETAKVFERTGHVVPVFNDKHLSYSWEDARWMYDTARRLKIPFMAGSSLPVTWRKPALELPVGTRFVEALAVGYSDLEAYGFHTLETLQCMIERRRGGERGVRAVQLLQGDAVWQSGDRGDWSWDLLRAALSRSETPSRNDVRKLSPEVYAFMIEFRDGLKANAIMLNGPFNEFLFAARLKDRPEPVATLFWLQEGKPFGHFYRLDRAIEQMIITGKPTYPVERTLLTTGILAYGMESKFQGNRKLDTPDLGIRYRVAGA